MLDQQLSLIGEMAQGAATTSGKDRTIGVDSIRRRGEYLLYTAIGIVLEDLHQADAQPVTGRGERNKHGHFIF